MFTLTETAGARLAKTLDKKQASDDGTMRFTRKSRSWKLSLDKPAVGDVLFAHEGRTVLVLDAEAAKLLVDRTLDTKDSLAGTKLQLR